MSRFLRGLGPALALAASLTLASLACSSGSDPASPPGAVADNTYVRATISLLDTAAPCRPGIACDPEFFSCDGATGFTVPTQWSVHATIATAGAFNYTAAVAPGSTAGAPATGTIWVTGTDTARNTSLSVAIAVRVDQNTSAVTYGMGGNPQSTFVNVESSCETLNGSRDPLTLFGLLTSQPSTVTLTEIPVSGIDLAFASRNGAELTGGILAGTFDFVAANRQEFGVAFVGNVRVQGCFRVPITNPLQGVAVDAVPPSPACN